MAGEPEECRLVGRGTFRVDAARALEKLRRYQLPDPWLFVRIWLRAAVLHGPARIEVKTAGLESLLRFDGAPLPPELVGDPYAHLFAEDDMASTQAGRMLGIGMLGLSALDPEAAVFRSGPMSELCVKWRDAGAARRFKTEVQQSAGMLRMPLALDGVDLPPCSALGSEFSGYKPPDGPRILFALPDAQNYDGVAALYRNGVLLQGVRHPTFKGLSMYINDDILTLNATASGAVQDQAFEAALQAALRHADSYPPPPRRVRPIDWDRFIMPAFLIFGTAGSGLATLMLASQVHQADSSSAVLIKGYVGLSGIGLGSFLVYLLLGGRRRK
ncbi:MAG: hypothetical protein HY928_01950 [Elusimicrobia bacterium]|nr:hypothetical protein [Elusimicrobiota bacterium]